MEIEQIVKKVKAYDCSIVEITGGEPLFQKEDTSLLATRLLAKDFTVLVETNGGYDIDLIDRRCVRVVDVKCPSSGEATKFHRKNLGYQSLFSSTITVPRFMRIGMAAEIDLTHL
jgi:7-carboxy-7-deazaguanine synthase